MWRWLRSLFAWLPSLGTEGLGVFGSVARRVSSPSQPAPPLPAAPEASAPRVILDLEPWLRAHFALAPAPEQVDPLEVQVLSRKVHEHFEQNRPDPASFPSLAARVIDLTEQPDLHLDDLARVVAEDPAIAFRILQVANSAFYRRSSDVEDLRTALQLLGLDEVARIAVGMAGRTLFDVEARAEYEALSRRWSALYGDAMTMAFSASWLGSELRVGQPGRAFLGGMFHDIGKTVAMRAIGTMAVRGEIEMVSDAMLDRVLEDVHLDLGVALHASWKLPEFLTTLCLRHHDPKVPAVPEFDDIQIIRVVSHLHLLCSGRADETFPMGELVQALGALRMGVPETQQLVAKMGEMAAHVRATLRTG